MPGKKRGLLIPILSVFAVGALSLLSRLPIGLLSRLGAWLGRLYYHFDRRRKKIGLGNLGLAFGQEKTGEELERILRAWYQQMGRSMLEFAALPRLNRKKIEPLVRVTGLEKIRAEQEAGHGVILLNAHVGNWELYVQSATIYGCPMHIVGRRANVGLLHDYIVRCRESHGTRVILRDNAARKILKLVKKREVLGIMFDQRGSTSRGVMVDFFGHPAPTNPTVAKIILKSGATVMTSFGCRNPDGTHTVTISDPLEIRRSEDLEADVLQFIQLYMKLLEDFIRQHPDQWLWIHRRWMKRKS